MIYRNPLHPIRDATIKTRVFGLDLLRAVAIVLVLYGHCVLLFPDQQRTILFRFIFLDPVTLFFVLSGFLIGRILLDILETEKLTINTLWYFWVRRWMRTVPAYLFTLILLACVYHKFNIPFILRYAFFAQNFNWPHPEWFPEAWSLSIEEWFYFFIPMLLFILMAFRNSGIRNTFLFTCLAVIIITPLYRWYRFDTISFSGRGGWDHLFRMQVLSRLDSLMYGVLGAYIWRFKASIWSYSNRLFLVSGMFLLLTTHIYNQTHINREAFYSSVFSFSVESFAVLLLLPFFAAMKSVQGNLAKGVTVVSIISYSLYLINMSFVSLYICQIVPHWELTGKSLLAYKILIYWIVVLPGAMVLYLFVEHPFMMLRDRITQRNTGNSAKSPKSSLSS